MTVESQQAIHLTRTGEMDSNPRGRRQESAEGSNVGASCDTADVLHIEQEMAKKANNMGVGVIDTRTGKIRQFTYDETDAFGRANPHLQVMAGHESAAAMAGIPNGDARGFILGKQASDWHVFNQSHLNRVDGQANTMRMAGQTFDDIVAALQAAGVLTPVIH